MKESAALCRTLNPNDFDLCLGHTPRTGVEDGQLLIISKKLVRMGRRMNCGDLINLTILSMSSVKGPYLSKINLLIDGQDGQDGQRPTKHTSFFHDHLSTRRSWKVR